MMAEAGENVEPEEVTADDDNVDERTSTVIRLHKLRGISDETDSDIIETEQNIIILQNIPTDAAVITHQSQLVDKEMVEQPFMSIDEEPVTICSELLLKDEFTTKEDFDDCLANCNITDQSTPNRRDGKVAKQTMDEEEIRPDGNDMHKMQDDDNDGSCCGDNDEEEEEEEVDIEPKKHPDIIQPTNAVPIIIPSGNDLTSWISALENGDISDPQVANLIRNNGLQGKGALKVITMGNKALICAKLGDVRKPAKAKVQCSVHGCLLTPSDAKHLTFFRFPKLPERCKAWSIFTRRRSLRLMDPKDLYISGCRICSAHFKISDFVNPFTRNRLTCTAVPSVFDSSQCEWFLDKDFEPQFPDPFPLPTVSSNTDTGMLKDRVIFKETDSVDHSDLCEYHRLLVKCVTVVETEIRDFKFCFKCGDPIHEPLRLLANIYQVRCKRGHSLLVTTEFGEKCRDWVIACQNTHRRKRSSDPPCHSPCHLCDDHFCPPHEFRPPPPLLSQPFVASEDDLSLPKKKKRGRKPTRRVRPVKPTKLPSVFPPLAKFAFRLASTADAAVMAGDSYDVVRSQMTNVFQNSKQTQLSEGHLKSDYALEQRRMLRRARCQIGRLEKRLDAAARRIQSGMVVDDETVLKQILPKYLSGVALKLMQTQVLLSIRQGTNMRWPPSVVALAKVIQLQSPLAYSMLRQIWHLPSKQTVNRLPLPPSDLFPLRQFLKRTFGTKEPGTETTRGEPAAAETPDASTTTNAPSATSSSLADRCEEETVTVVEAAGDDGLVTMTEAAAVNEDRVEEMEATTAVDRLQLDRNEVATTGEAGDEGDEGKEEEEEAVEAPVMVIEMPGDPSQLSELERLGLISADVQADGTCVYHIMADPSELEDGGGDFHFHMVAPMFQSYTVQHQQGGDDLQGAEVMDSS